MLQWLRGTQIGETLGQFQRYVKFYPLSGARRGPQVPGKGTKAQVISFSFLRSSFTTASGTVPSG